MTAKTIPSILDAMEVKAGQRWKVLKRDSNAADNLGHIYTIEFVQRNGNVVLWCETTNKAASTSYDKKLLDNAEKWEFMSEGPESECPNCGQVKVKAVDDFMCVDCRKEHGMEARLIAEYESDLTIVSFRSSPESITFLREGREFLRFSRSDLPEPVIKAIRDFIGS